MQDNILSIIGLATKAGKVVSGEFSVEKAVKSGKAFLVIVSEDASDNTKKMFTNMCAFYNVPMYLYGNKETLGKSMGKEMRASAALLDEGFSVTIIKKIQMEQN